MRGVRQELQTARWRANGELTRRYYLSARRTVATNRRFTRLLCCMEVWAQTTLLAKAGRTPAGAVSSSISSFKVVVFFSWKLNATSCTWSLITENIQGQWANKFTLKMACTFSPEKHNVRLSGNNATWLRSNTCWVIVSLHDEGFPTKFRCELMLLLPLWIIS